MRCRAPILWSVTLLLAGPLAAAAQPLGTFRWQLQPFCNLVSVLVTQAGAVYQLDGTDDQCGGGGQASVVGTAFPNPGGTIGFGLTIVAAPGGVPIHVEAELSFPSLSGTWRDSAGHSGAFVFTPGAGNGGTPRPATGTIGALAVNPAEVQLRVGGACPSDQFMRVIHENGTVSCAAAPVSAETGDISGVAAGPGLAGGGASGDVALGLRVTGGAFDFSNANGLISTGTYGAGGLAPSGPGTRLVWYPRRAALRAGYVDDTQWDDANIGDFSVAFSQRTRATGYASTAFGLGTLASDQASTAMGYTTTASGVASTAMGYATSASGQASTAMGYATTASGFASTAMGELNTASGRYSVAIGDRTTASGAHSVAAGVLSSAAGASGIALGGRVHASGDSSVVLGFAANALAAAHGTFIFADTSTSTPIVGYAPNEFLVRSAGGVGFYTNAALTAGAWIPPGGSSWSAISDRNRKEHFRDLSGDEVLRKLARMPIQEWNYKAQDEAIRHVGPTAQDFYAAFGLGEDPLRINTIDADGIALAAIRALEARTAALMREIERLRGENQRIRAQLDRVERRSERR